MFRLILMLCFALASSAWAQDATPDEQAANEAASASETEDLEGLTEDDLEDLDIDSQTDHTEEDEDVFKPTDVVSFQQSVNFPVDI